ncbi:hypothetical protein BDZ91DRAFT_765674 [Kalaharituber pfeilii]|nr:hypothetical protein BDZ91DRAFT_765674 [Kalaharituber pfeilii]
MGNSQSASGSSNARFRRGGGPFCSNRSTQTTSTISTNTTSPTQYHDPTSADLILINLRLHPCQGNSTIHPSFYAFYIAPQPTPHQSLAKDFPHPAFASLFPANTSWSLVIASRGKVAVAEWAVSGTLEMDSMGSGEAKWRMGMGMQSEKELVVVGERSWGAFLDGVARVIGSGEVIGVDAAFTYLNLCGAFVYLCWQATTEVFGIIGYRVAVRTLLKHNTGCIVSLDMRNDASARIDTRKIAAVGWIGWECISNGKGSNSTGNGRHWCRDYVTQRIGDLHNPMPGCQGDQDIRRLNRFNYHLLGGMRGNMTLIYERSTWWKRTPVKLL